MNFLVAMITMLILLPALAESQTLPVTNASSSVIIYRLRGEKYPHSPLAPGEKGQADYNAANGAAEFYLQVMQGCSFPPGGYFSKSLKNGVLVITEEDTKKTGAKSFADLNPTISAPLTTPQKSSANSVSGTSSSIQKTLVALKNGSEHRMVLLDGDFQGAAPPCHKESKEKRLLAPGLKQWSLLYDKDIDSASTGKNYMQAVFSKILSEGDTVLTIRDADIMFNLGKPSKIVLHSLINFKFYFVGGTFAGVAMSPWKYWQGKKILNYGPNSFSVQFFQDGIKFQANLEIIITPQDKILDIRPEDIKNAEAIGGSQPAPFYGVH